MPRKSIELSVKFCPLFSVEYNAKAFLESDQGNFIIDLIGLCVSPKLELDESEKVFGVVGIGRPEFKDITVSNPTTIPFTVRVKSDIPEFIVGPL
jgi:hypothetical protein